MQARRLSESEFQSTFGGQMVDITGREDTVSPVGVIDVIPYVDAVPAADLGPHTLQDHVVGHVYRSSDDRYDHVLFMTGTKNVYLVVVVDLGAGRVRGHHLLDLNEKYGIADRGICS